MGQITIERGRHRPHAVLRESQLLVHLVVVRARDAHDHVGVAVDVLRDGVHDDVCTVLERVLEVRTAEGVVHREEGADAPRERRDLAYVRHPQRGIRRRLEPKQLRRPPPPFAVGRDHRLDGVVVSEIHEVDVDAHAGLHDPAEVTLRPAVHVVYGQYPLPGRQEVHDRGGGRAAGGERDAGRE